MKKIIRFTMLALVFTLTLGGVTIMAETSEEPNVFVVKSALVFAKENPYVYEEELAVSEEPTYEIDNLKQLVIDQSHRIVGDVRIDSINITSGEYQRSYDSIEDIPDNEKVKIMADENFGEIEISYNVTRKDTFLIQMSASDDINTVSEHIELQKFKSFDLDTHTFILNRSDISSLYEKYATQGYEISSVRISAAGFDQRYRSIEEIPETLELVAARVSESSNYLTVPNIYIQLIKYFPEDEIADEKPYELHNILGRAGASGPDIMDLPYLGMPSAGSKVDKVRVIFPTLNIDEVNNSYYERYITTVEDSSKYMRLRSFDDLSLEPTTDPYIMAVRNLAMQINAPRLDQDYLDHNNISDFYERYSEDDFATYFIVYNQDTYSSEIYKRGLIDGKYTNNGVNLIAELPGDHVNYFTLIPDGVIPGYDYSDQVPHPEVIDGNTPFNIKFNYGGYGFGFGGRVSEHESVTFTVPQNIGEYPDLKFVGYGLTKDTTVPIIKMDDSEPIVMNTIDLLTQLQKYVEESGYRYDFEFYPVYISEEEPGKENPTDPDKEEPEKEVPTDPDKEEPGKEVPTDPDKEELDKETPTNPNPEKPIEKDVSEEANEKEVVKDTTNGAAKSNDKKNSDKVNETVKTGVQEQSILYVYGLLISITSLVLVSLIIKKRNIKE